MNLNPGHLPTYKALFPVLRTQTGAIDRLSLRLANNGLSPIGLGNCCQLVKRAGAWGIFKWALGKQSGYQQGL